MKIDGSHKDLRDSKSALLCFFDRYTHLVMVPSMSEITTKSVESHIKILAVQATAPLMECEKVIELGPGFRLRDF